jgi:Inhibitor of vertebrate lysozyme (Ivy)
MNAPSPRICIGVAIFVVAEAAWCTELTGDIVNRYGGVYSTDCSDPSAARVRAGADSLSVEVANRRMTGTNVEISVSPFGNQLPPPGQEVVLLLSQVRGDHGLSFWVHRDVSGQFIQIEADPAITQALGKALVAKRFVDCDASRSQRAAEEAKADVDRAAAEAVAEARPKAGEARFRSAYLRALGPLAKGEEWLVSEVPRPTDATTVTIAGTRYRQLTGCKPHDCGDNNALVLFAPQTGAVYGQLMVRQMPRQIGAPPPEVAAALDRLWRAEWRQGR